MSSVSTASAIAPPISGSGSHADIINRSGQYYVSDRNSKGGTYINGCKLIPELETEIVDGDLLRLANIEFIFRV